VQVAKARETPTKLGGTQFVEVPHYKFAVPRTREDLVVKAWVLAEIKFFHFAETYSHDPKQRQC